MRMRVPWDIEPSDKVTIQATHSFWNRARHRIAPATAWWSPSGVQDLFCFDGFVKFEKLHMPVTKALIKTRGGVSIP